MPGVSMENFEEEPSQHAPPMWLPIQNGTRIRALRARYHGPGEYYFHCPCQDCRMHFQTDPPGRAVEVATLEVSRPKYSYMGFVNSLHDAAAKREEDRLEKLRAEREAAAAAAEASEKDKASKDQAKND